MKSNTKSNLIILVLIFAFLPSIFNNSSYIIGTNKNLSYNDDFNSNVDILQPSKISGQIHINNNWTTAKIAGICTGNGTYSEPYVIEDLEINSGESGTCILIENSDVYFKIENCTLTAGFPYPNSGIHLNNVIEGYLVINYCIFSANGFYLENCNNITMSGNIANNNGYGFYLENCNNITMSGNIANNNGYGIKLDNCNNNIISGNIVSNNTNWGIYLHINCYDNVISGNIVNSNSLGIYLGLSHNNIISGNTANNNDRGLFFSYSDFNIISGNTANNNDRGIYLSYSDFNIVSGNTLIGNNECISEERCQGNSFSNNGDCTYDQVSTPLISGYSLIFLFSTLSIIVIIIYIKKKNFEIKDNCT
ncbi:MAG: nitrous oxide reductase family maturation protein NosD [Promethearchaeota archaeon]